MRFIEVRIFEDLFVLACTEHKSEYKCCKIRYLTINIGAGCVKPSHANPQLRGL